jgi:hypothetical protein
MGWLAIRESWITIFSNTEMIRFTIKNTKIRIFDNKLAVVVCVENIKITGVDGRIIRIGGIATNVTNYMLRNVCSQ